MPAQAHVAAAGTITLGGDLTVRRLGFGAMRITGPESWGNPPDPDQAIATLRRAIDLGVNFIDTADAYGPAVSENLIAGALHPYPDDLVIATKGGLTRPGPHEWKRDGRPEHLRRACEASLTRLRLEQIPLYQLHKPDPDIPIAESVGALADLQAEGKIRHIGVSAVDAEQLLKAQSAGRIASVQNRYNATDRTCQDILDICTRQRLAFIPWAPIQQADTNQAIIGVAARHGITPHQAALAWLLAISTAMLPIPGTGSPMHVEDNAMAAAVDLTSEDIAAILKN